MVASCTPPTGDLIHNSGMCPRLGIKPATLWFTGLHSIHWDTSARAIILFMLVLYYIPFCDYTAVYLSISLMKIWLFLYYYYSQTLVLQHVPCRTIQFLTKLFMEKNVSAVKQNFGSQPDNPFMLKLVWSVMRLSGSKQKRECASMSMIQFSNKALLQQPSGTN